MAQPKPKTQREMIEQLWYAMIGSNGDGEIAQNKKMREEFHAFLQHRAETCPVRPARLNLGQKITLAVAACAQVPPWIWIIAKSISEKAAG